MPNLNSLTEEERERLRGKLIQEDDDRRLNLAAGGPQEPRSEPAPAIHTVRATPALRIDLRTGIVDLRSVPPLLLYGEELGEYRRALDLATAHGWGWTTTCGALSVIVVNRLAMTGGPA